MHGGGSSPRRLRACCKTSLPPGELLGMSHTLGHRLRDGGFPAPAETRKTGCSDHRRRHLRPLGGMATGQCRGRRLFGAGNGSEAGGNSRAGQSPLVAYPWGAHYLPLPTLESTSVRQLLAELAFCKVTRTPPSPPTMNATSAPRRRSASIAMACGKRVCCRIAVLMPLSVNSSNAFTN
jgi:hypothetical protein